MTQRKVLLLNAPPNAGKDTIAHELSLQLLLPHLEFKGKLFEIACVISGLKRCEWDALYCRKYKEEPSDKLFGMSPREFLIDISERMVKPACGQDYFGKALGHKAYKFGGVVSDSGFNQEAEALCDIVGDDNVLCVRFTREGCTFEGDSRRFVDTPRIKHYLDTTNDGTIDEIVNKIKEWYHVR